MPPTANKNYLLLDTCIAEYWLDQYLNSEVQMQLAKWADNSLDLAISEISYAELINGAYQDKVKKVLQLLKTYTRIEISQRVLTGAGILSNVYRACFDKTNGASLEDKIIAATSFIYNLPIVTANIADYPHPFFTTIASENLEYTKKGKKHIITIDVLKPNVLQLNYWHGKLR